MCVQVVQRTLCDSSNGAHLDGLDLVQNT